MSSKSSNNFSKKNGLFKRAELAIIDKIIPKTHFSENDFKYLLKVFRKYASQGQFIEKTDFLEMLHETFGYTEHFFMNRVFIQADTNRDGRISLSEYINLLSLLLKGTKEEKIKFCFQCYDLNETMQLSRDVIITLLNQTSTEVSDFYIQF
nr:EF-hand calcium-binding domain-containing protein 1-like [Parasteatoda tepidariorum]